MSSKLGCNQYVCETEYFISYSELSDGAGTRLPEYSTRTGLFLGHPNLTFPGQVDIRLYPR